MLENRILQNQPRFIGWSNHFHCKAIVAGLADRRNCFHIEAVDSTSWNKQAPLTLFGTGFGQTLEAMKHLEQYIAAKARYTLRCLQAGCISLE